MDHIPKVSEDLSLCFTGCMTHYLTDYNLIPKSKNQLSGGKQIILHIIVKCQLKLTPVVISGRFTATLNTGLSQLTENQ